MGIGSQYWYSYRPARSRAWSIRMLASAVRPATLQAECCDNLYVFSEVFQYYNRIAVNCGSIKNVRRTEYIWSDRFHIEKLKWIGLTIVISSKFILFHLTFEGANKPLVTRLSLAITMPSFASIPTHVPALLIASIAYSTW